MVPLVCGTVLPTAGELIGAVYSVFSANVASVVGMHDLVLLLNSPVTVGLCSLSGSGPGRSTTVGVSLLGLLTLSVAALLLGCGVEVPGSFADGFPVVSSFTSCVSDCLFVSSLSAAG